MQYWQAILVISCFIVLYNYAGYAFLSLALNVVQKRRNRDTRTQDAFPTLSFIVAAYNEEEFIEKKILNSLSLDYSGGQIEYIFITDGSSDNTPQIVSRHPAVRLLHQPERKGKSEAVNRAVETARGEVLIFSDANTTLNQDALRLIARHYRHANTGGVAGEKKVIAGDDGSDEVGGGEGLYWKYESMLKKIDSDFHSVVGAAGELFSVRRELYQPIGSNIILDDFMISLRVAEKGYRIIYEPGAYAMEAPSASLKDERKRKVRIAAGGFQSIALLASLLAFWRHFRLSFLYISHRVLRWTLSPLCMILALVSAIVLALTTQAPLYIAVAGVQILFYGMAAIAALLPAKKRGKLLKLPYYFTFMNVSVILGFFRYLRGSQSAVWEKAQRAQPSPAPEP
jgi:cellulose synthase/poly-beta-1,6-N-acetylglucosamine synthase-like glycosyltransferase